MGAWGHQFSENDDAADWLADFEDSPTWALIDEALSVVDLDYVEAPEACIALAAAEIVAAALGKPNLQLAESTIAWTADQSAPAGERREAATKVLLRVKADSELQELWEETDDYADWVKSVDETLSRL
jgi:Domain of unknown function (DUF4259)